MDTGGRGEDMMLCRRGRGVVVSGRRWRGV